MIVALKVKNWYVQGAEFYGQDAEVLGEVVNATMGEQIIDEDTGEVGYFSIIPFDRTQPDFKTDPPSKT